MKKEMKLIKLTLKNFKGIRQFVLETNGKNVRVHGDNGTGKTSLFDSFIWLLFGKDSQNKTDFQLKTVNADGAELHGLEHEVEGVFSVDGNELVLRKVYTEKWTKKRGSATKEFTGHTTDHYINSVPSNKKEFDSKVASLVDEDVFKLLTSPSYFNDQLHWKKRRDILLEICGDVSDEDVIKNNKGLEKLSEFIGEKSIEDLKKIIAAKRSEINKELDKIPVRIDEVQRAVPDVSNLDEKDIKNEIASTKSLIEHKEDEISRIRNGAEVSHKEKQLREIETELIDLKNQHHIANNQKVNEKRKELYKLQDDLENIQYDVKRKMREHSDGLESVNTLTQKTESLRNGWREINAKTFEYNGDTDCPTCGQDLPSDQIEAAKEKALADFNHNKSRELERINKIGKQDAQKLKETKERNEVLESEIETLKKKSQSIESSMEALHDEIKSMEFNVTDISEDPQYQAKKQEAEEIKKQIKDIQDNLVDSTEKVRNEIVGLKNTVHSLEADLSKFAAVRHSDKRMKELQDEEKRLAKEFEQLEEQLFLTEEFIRAKVELLEEKINSKFKYARFKLFDQQVNGGLNEVCETTFKGVPYSAGLNNAARINVGLDIINTLSDYYNFAAPIFVDNAEAVTKLIDMNTQVISLVVSEADKELRIEQ